MSEAYNSYLQTNIYILCFAIIVLNRLKLTSKLLKTNI